MLDRVDYLVAVQQEQVAWVVVDFVGVIVVRVVSKNVLDVCIGYK